MTEKKNDYDKLGYDLTKYLPDVYQSDTLNGMIENLFNRFLTKSETKRVSGYIGQGSLISDNKRQIQESTPHRQAFQLQPIMSSKIGTVNNMRNWDDILGELTRLDVDTSKLRTIINSLKFNWVPPIDMNKIINYQDYYWYDPENPTSTPQYITVRNNCIVAKSKYNFLHGLGDSHGFNNTIIGVDTVNKTLLFNGNLVDLFSTGFRFHIYSSNNSTLSESIVLKSVYDYKEKQTTVTIDTGFYNAMINDVATIDMVVSETLSLVSCECIGTSGFDTNSWDSFPYDGSCLTRPTVVGIEQWSSQNKWVHKTDLVTYSQGFAATCPIIEFELDLEMNEWNGVDHLWKYRKETYGSFHDTDLKPSMLELQFAENIVLHPTINTIELPYSMGDVSDFLKPDVRFAGFIGPYLEGTFVVVDSYYEENTIGHLTTKVQLSASDYSSYVSLGIEKIAPLLTSKGDTWKGYDRHWVYVKATTPYAYNHVDVNPDNEEFSQTYNTTTSTTTFYLSSTLTNIALAGYNNIRVYINDVRTYGNYDEISNVDNFVIGITFHHAIMAYNKIRIELAPASIYDIGRNAIPVRMEEDDVLFNSRGSVTVSLIRFRKTEQIKRGINQYPLYDMYDVFSESNKDVSHIFGYKEDSNYKVLSQVGRRVVRDSNAKDYTFSQELIDEDNGALKAYRNYTLLGKYIFWHNTKTLETQYWNGYSWSRHAKQGLRFTTIHSDKFIPTKVWDGMLWYDTLNNQLKVANIVSSVITWTVVDDQYVCKETYDITLETIWRKGRNNEEYVPRYVNKNNKADGELDYDHTTKDYFTVSLEDGSAEGHWEIPDQLYFNNLHENRKDITLKGLFTHFKSIIDSQPHIPSMASPPTEAFRILNTAEVNFGLGGHIKEFNDGFDTLLSSIFVNNVEPRQLIAFANEQYIGVIRQIRDYFIKESVTLLAENSDDMFNDLDNTIANRIINQYGNNAYLDSIYGDSSTYDQKTNTGIQNIIATLPYLRFISKRVPYKLVDLSLGINGIRHHEGHFSNHNIPEVTIDSIYRTLIDTNDNYPYELLKIGKLSTNYPPITRTQFITDFGENFHRGVYWYRVNGATRTLYKLSVAAVNDKQPSNYFIDGSLWYDTEEDVLKIKQGSNWIVPIGFAVGDKKLMDGTTPENSHISAWKAVDLNDIYTDLLALIEQKLYENVPEYNLFAYDMTPIRNDSTYKAKMEDRFYNYCYLNEIISPLSAIGHYSATNAWTWNYGASSQYNYDHPSSNVTPYTNIKVGGDWKDLYEKTYNTPFPHLEPWKILGYVDKPNWWDTEYLNNDKDTYGARKWKSTFDLNTHVLTGMWNTIRTGIIPAGYLLPDGITTSNGITAIPGYTPPLYLCVNITGVPLKASDDIIYAPDDLFPPYWIYEPTTTLQYYDGTNWINHSFPLSSGSSFIIRSMFYDYTNHIKFPEVDYNFNDGILSPVEWDWRHSSQFNYDEIDVAFRIQPMRTMNFLFGIDFAYINNLQIDPRTKTTFSHYRTVFHGDIQNVNEYYIANGFNQWYVNFNRYSGFDISASDFRAMWTLWTAPLSYQFDSFLDPSTLFISHKILDITKQDYSIYMKKSEGVEEHWMDALKVYILEMPAPTSRIFNDMGWRFILSRYTPNNHDIQYYGVHSYPCKHVGNNVFRIYSFDIAVIDLSNNRIEILYNYKDAFPNTTISITGSTFNNGTYHVKDVYYNGNSDRTVVTLQEPLIDVLSDGIVNINFRTIPWSTGDELWLSSTNVMPTGFRDDIPYFIIKEDDYHFRLADTKSEALTHTFMTVPFYNGDLTISQVASRFQALDGVKSNRLWFHYAVDKNYVRKITTNKEVRGMQNLINIVHGYSEYIKDSGFECNGDYTSIDEYTSRPIDWYSELERFIDWAYGIRHINYRNDVRYVGVLDDATTGVWSFLDAASPYVTGKQVIIYTTAYLPTPLHKSTPYYIIRDNATNFRLALSYADAMAGIGMTYVINPNVPMHTIYFAPLTSMITNLPSFEINAFRNNLRFYPSRGIVSDMIHGPFTGYIDRNLIINQYSSPIDPIYVRIIRHDGYTDIKLKQDIYNPYSMDAITNPTSYNRLHMSGVHLYLDTFEHVIMFNNYNEANQLIYDPFLGLNSTKFELDFYRHTHLTERPNVGGYYLNGEHLERNIEASIDDMRYYYDTFNVQETTEVTRQSRAVLGYDGLKSYMSEINVGPKSQFLYYRGLIQHKGSMTALTAFSNSRRFVDMAVDEFWAYRLADFGSVHEKEYTEMYVKPRDTIKNEIMYNFEGDLAGYENAALNNFDRWYEAPNQVKTLKNNGGSMYFTMKPWKCMHSGNNSAIFRNADITSSLPKNNTLNIIETTFSSNIIQHNFKCDYLRILVNLYPENTKFSYIHSGVNVNDITITSFIYNTKSLIVFKNGIEMKLGIDYTENTPIGFMSSSIHFILPVVNGDDIEVIYKIGELIPNTHYTIINSDIVRIEVPEVLTADDVTLWGYIPDYDAQDMMRFVDKGSSTILSNIQLFDPGRGRPYYLANNVIDIRNNNDPAKYNSSPLGQNEAYWDSKFVGIIWLDNTNLDYVPYHDTTIFPKISERSKYWGRLADWSSIKLYEWIESEFTPDEWELGANIQDITSKIVLDDIRISGTPRKLLFKKNETTSAYEIVNNIVEHHNVLIHGTTVPTGTRFTLSDINIVNLLISNVSVDENTISISGFHLDTIVVGLSFNVSGNVQINGDYTVNTVEYDGDNNITTITTNEDLVGTNLIAGNIKFYPMMNYYVNGIVGKENVQADINGHYIVPGLRNCDGITFATFTIENTNIEIGVQYGKLQYTCPYTTIITIDKFNQTIKKYYYWIANNKKRGSNKIMSTFQATNELKTITIPFAIPQNPVVESSITDVTVSVDRTQTFNGGGSSFTLYNVPSFIKNVYVAGEPVSYVSPVGNSRTVTTLVTVPPATDVVIDYQIFEEVRLPIRYTQLIVKGLLGRVHEEKRYAIQFTRDYSLRDRLYNGETELDLKNVHNEWELFRVNQVTNVRRELWDSITESIVGHKLLNPVMVVPSLDRVLYDKLNGTDTRFGIGTDKAFVDGELAKKTIISFLTNPNNDFSPIDIDDFMLTNNNLETNSDVIGAMDIIYNTFKTNKVNELFFLVLHDALSGKRKFNDIFKTSFIALHGKTTLITQNQFDD